MTSKPFLDDVGCSEPKSFVIDAIKNKEICTEDIMSENNQYNMNRVCFVEECDLKCGDIVVELKMLKRNQIEEMGNLQQFHRFLFYVQF